MRVFVEMILYWSTGLKSRVGLLGENSERLLPEGLFFVRRRVKPWSFDRRGH